MRAWLDLRLRTINYLLSLDMLVRLKKLKAGACLPGWAKTRCVCVCCSNEWNLPPKLWRSPLIMWNVNTGAGGLWEKIVVILWVKGGSWKFFNGVLPISFYDGRNVVKTKLQGISKTAGTNGLAERILMQHKPHSTKNLWFPLYFH